MSYSLKMIGGFNELCHDRLLVSRERSHVHVDAKRESSLRQPPPRPGERYGASRKINFDTRVNDLSLASHRNGLYDLSEHRCSDTRMFMVSKGTPCITIVFSSFTLGRERDYLGQTQFGSNDTVPVVTTVINRCAGWQIITEEGMRGGELTGP
jgi:hypothetical protein